MHERDPKRGVHTYVMSKSDHAPVTNIRAVDSGICLQPKDDCENADDTREEQRPLGTVCGHPILFALFPMRRGRNRVRDKGPFMATNHNALEASDSATADKWRDTAGRRAWRWREVGQSSFFATARAHSL